MDDLRTYRRNINLRALYAHGASCACPSCSQFPISNFQFPILADGEFDNRFRKIAQPTEEDFIRRLYRSKWKKNNLDPILWREYYSRVRQFTEAGFGRKLTDPADWAEFDLMERLKRNASGFAGGKVATISEQLRQYRKLPLNRFEKVAKGLLKAHNRDYLEAELQTALASANSAAKWQGIERNTFLYPNLRYETAGDERVRQGHRQLDQVVYPVNHSFWDRWMPPNGWRCRCIVIQTDAPANNVGDDFDLDIPKGFDNNPGRTGKLFADDHPYFDWSKKDLSSIAKSSEGLRAEWETPEVFKLASQFVGTKQRLTGMTKAAEVNQAFISKTFAGKHIEQAIKNDLLTVIALMGGEAKLLTIEADTYIYSIAVAESTFTLRIENNVFVIIS